VLESRPDCIIKNCPRPVSAYPECHVIPFTIVADRTAEARNRWAREDRGLHGANQRHHTRLVNDLTARERIVLVDRVKGLGLLLWNK